MRRSVKLTFAAIAETGRLGSNQLFAAISANGSERGFRTFAAVANHQDDKIEVDIHLRDLQVFPPAKHWMPLQMTPNAPCSQEPDRTEARQQKI